MKPGYHNKEQEATSIRKRSARSKQQPPSDQYHEQTCSDGMKGSLAATAATAAAFAAS